MTALHIASTAFFLTILALSLAVALPCIVKAVRFLFTPAHPPSRAESSSAASAEASPGAPVSEQCARQPREGVL